MNDNNNNEDPCKREGHLQLKITIFSEFAREEEGSLKRSEPLQLLGYQWNAYASIRNQSSTATAHKFLGFYLGCIGNDGGSSTSSCTATATFKMLAQKQGKQDFVHEHGTHEYLIDGLAWGCVTFMSLQKLMNPENGWYDEVNDTIVLSLDFIADVPHGISCFVARNHVVLVNGKEVEVNKNQLAYHFDYFERFFFGEDSNENNNELLLELPATVEHFERMLDTLHPINQPVDDDCIEGVCHLANQFLLTGVEEKCRTFLANESKHSAIFKYRLADKYGFDMLKKQLLDPSKKADFFKEADFPENLEEYAKLDGKAREALAAHLGPVPPPIVGICERFWTGLDTTYYALLLAAINSTYSATGQPGSKRALEVVSVNGVQIKVNKYHLAANSDFFERFFYGQGYKANNKLELELPAHVGHFKRMLDTLHPKKKPLDDQCIEPVLHLANQFLLLEVEAKCRTFLANQSKHSIVFKYRLADKYSFNMLKKLILDSPKEEFTGEADYFENLEEYAKLDKKVREALNARIVKKFAKDVAQ